MEQKLLEFIAEEIDSFADEPLVGKLSIGIRGRLLEIVQSVESSPPTNHIELGQICHSVDLILEPALEMIKDLAQGKRSQKSILKHIKDARNKVAKVIVQRQKLKDEWGGVSWPTREATIDNVKRTISAYLGIPDKNPPHGSEEWNRIRSRIIDIVQNDFVNWGIANAFIKNDWFTSYIDVLITVFDDDYAVKNQLDTKRKPKIWTWETPKQTIENARNKVSEELNIPAIMPERKTPEWFRIRQKIIDVTHDNFYDWRIASAFVDNRWFSSYLDVLIAAFDDKYDIKDELEAKKHDKVFEWKSREQTIENVQQEVSKNLEIPSPIPPKGSVVWIDIRLKVVCLTFHRHFKPWRLDGACNKDNKWFSSHIDVLIATFPELELKRWYFSSLGRSSLKIVNQTPENAVTDNDLLLIKAILAGPDQHILDTLLALTRDIPVRRSRLIDFDEQKSMAFEKMIRDIRIMGEECPVNLRKLWQTANKCVRIAVFWEHAKHRIPIKIRKELKAIQESPFPSAEDMDVMIDLEIALENFDADQRTELLEFISDEIDLDRNPDDIRIVLSF